VDQTPPPAPSDVCFGETFYQPGQNSQCRGETATGTMTCTFPETCQGGQCVLDCTPECSPFGDVVLYPRLTYSVTDLFRFV